MGRHGFWQTTVTGLAARHDLRVPPSFPCCISTLPSCVTAHVSKSTNTSGNAHGETQSAQNSSRNDRRDRRPLFCGQEDPRHWFFGLQSLGLQNSQAPLLDTGIDRQDLNNLVPGHPGTASLYNPSSHILTLPILLASHLRNNPQTLSYILSSLKQL